MRIVVLGAGVIGVTSAWYLHRAGHTVTVVERRPAPGLETSFANGGQLSAGHPEPWANPRAPAQVLRWLGREDAPLLFRPRADAAQWLWGLRFLRECLPGRSRRNTAAIARLALYSRDRLAALDAETRLEYGRRDCGILHLFFDEPALRAAAERAARLRELGIRLERRNGQECLAIEPALSEARVAIAGGLYAPDDASGDAHAFTSALAALAARSGVEFRYGWEVTGFEVQRNRVAGLRLRGADGRGDLLEGDACVVALGSYSPLLLAPLGLRLPIYPVKGYSATLPVSGPGTPTVSLTDETHRLVFSRLGDRLRVAGTAELSGYDSSINMARCEAILRRCAELFPAAADRSRAEFWAGLRPATPGNLPLIGPARYPNLFLNAGHGTLGWTLACGSAQALADLVSGRRPEVDFPFRACG